MSVEPNTKRWLVIINWLLAPLLVEILSWQGINLVGGASLDQSWQAGLEMALHFHLAFGSRVIFAYGPLGFLTVGSSAGMTAVWYGSLAIVALAYTIAIRFALSAAIYHAARSSYGSVAGFLIALVGVGVVAPFFADLSILLIALVWALGAKLKPRDQFFLAGLGAMAAALESLEKVSIGASAIVMVAVYVLAATDGRRRLAQVGVTLGSYLVTLLVLWLAIGQPLNALPDYIRGSYEISSGYSAAMSTTQAGLGWTFTVAFVLGGVGLWVAWTSSDRLARRKRVAVRLLWALFWFSAFKEGFVRQDTAHVPIFLSAMVGGMFAFRLRRDQRILGVACLTLSVCAWMASLGVTFTQMFHPRGSLSALASDIKLIANTGDRTKLLSETRSNVLNADALPKGSLKLLRGHTVAIYPNELVVVWAYKLDWRPLPVLQSYSAYTPWLDRLDANYLASAKAPQRIIVQAGTTDVDGRFLNFDEPYATMAIFCRYRPLLLTSSYGIFARATNRCSPRQKLKTVEAGWGKTVQVPTPPTSRSLVLATVEGAQPSGLESLEGVLFKPTAPDITINGSPPLRFVTGTAGDGLPLTAPSDVDYPWPYTVTPLASRIAIGRESATQPSGQLTYTFYAVTVRPRH
jgi:hypothetical protein